MTATDLVLTLTEMLRAHGVVGKFVEFFGPGVGRLTLPDRATLSQHVARSSARPPPLFPVDAETLRYLVDTGRPPEQVELVERYTKEQGLFRTDDEPEPALTARCWSSTWPPSSRAWPGPRRPQDRVRSAAVPSRRFALDGLSPGTEGRGFGRARSRRSGEEAASRRTARWATARWPSPPSPRCTNTSNPIA